jgi:hypothetical protein
LKASPSRRDVAAARARALAPCATHQQIIGSGANVCLIAARLACAPPGAAARSRAPPCARAVEPCEAREPRKAIEFFFVDNVTILLRSRFTASA